MPPTPCGLILSFQKNQKTSKITCGKKTYQNNKFVASLKLKKTSISDYKWKYLKHPPTFSTYSTNFKLSELLGNIWDVTMGTVSLRICPSNRSAISLDEISSEKSVATWNEKHRYRLNKPVLLLEVSIFFRSLEKRWRHRLHYGSASKHIKIHHVIKQILTSLNPNFRTTNFMISLW